RQVHQHRLPAVEQP
nr:immunoglobulin heavy chain junction region [Homo sapiens]